MHRPQLEPLRHKIEPQAHGRHTRYIADCLDVLPRLPDESFDLLLTDPPWALPAQFYVATKSQIQKRWSDTSILTAWWRQIIEATVPKMKPNGTLIVFSGDDALSAFYPVMYENTHRVQLATWDKGSIAMGRPLRRQSEFLIFAYMNSKPVQNSTTVSTVLKYPRVPSQKKAHPSQKPVEMLADLMEAFTPKGGTVLDLFAGSFSTEAAAEKTGRIATSIDCDPPLHTQQVGLDDDGAAAKPPHARTSANIEGPRYGKS